MISCALIFYLEIKMSLAILNNSNSSSISYFTNHTSTSSLQESTFLDRNTLADLITYIALSILTVGMLPLIHLVILPMFKCVKHISTPQVNLQGLINKLLETSEDNKCQEGLTEISQLITNNRIQFNRVYDHHFLHDRVTDITLKARHDPRLKAIWQTFLQSIHQTHADCPLNKNVLLDFSTEFDYLNNPSSSPGEVEIEQLNKSATPDILQEIVDIEIESFGSNVAYNVTTISQHLQNRDHTIFVARDPKTKKIQGYIFSRQEKDINQQWQQHITSVARKADAAKRGVARQLFQNYQQHVPSGYTVMLEVRETNKAAIKLYSDCGFKPSEIISEYYSNPRENAIRMLA